MKDRIKRNLDGRKILLLFIATNIVYLIMLTVTIPGVMRFSGGMVLLDMLPTGYDPSYVKSLLNKLGESGRSAYLVIQIPLDMIYPLLFGITYCLITAYFLKKIGKLETSLFYVCLLPLFAGLFDYFENIGIIVMLVSYPDLSVTMARVTNVFSILKSSFTTISFIALIIILITLGSRKLFKKNKGIV